MKVTIDYRITAGGYKTIPYEFKDEEEYEKFMENNTDERIRKIIGIHKSEE